MEYQELSFTLPTDLEEEEEEEEDEEEEEGKKGRGERKGKGRNATFLQLKTSSVASRAQVGWPAGRPTASTAATGTRS